MRYKFAIIFFTINTKIKKKVKEISHLAVQAVKLQSKLNFNWNWQTRDRYSSAHHQPAFSINIICNQLPLHFHQSCRMMVIFHMLRAYSEFKLWQEATRVHTNNEDSNPKTFSFRIIMLTKKRVNLRQELLEYFWTESKALYPTSIIW